MSQDQVISVFSAALVLALKLAGPVLAIAVVIGLAIAIMQAATQVHEQTLTFAPKAIAVALALLAFGPWMLNELIDFMTMIFEMMTEIGIS
ncbi:flagellar biosynthetic protein FliQ [Clostridia bacterium]|nr:flagellar biosynthetic protein FliQ [Clostridia bacterium]